MLRCICCYMFFFFKQKTAYEMRISDWSSDVCSSDLATRINDARPKMIVSASCGVEPSRVVPYKPLLDAAIDMATSKPEKCRSEERRVGKECVSTCRSRWSPYH